MFHNGDFRDSINLEGIPGGYPVKSQGSKTMGCPPPLSEQRLVALERQQKKKKKSLADNRAAEEIMETHSSWNQKVLKWTSIFKEKNVVLGQGDSQ